MWRLRQEDLRASELQNQTVSPCSKTKPHLFWAPLTFRGVIDIQKRSEITVTLHPN